MTDPTEDEASALLDAAVQRLGFSLELPPELARAGYSFVWESPADARYDVDAEYRFRSRRWRS